MMLDIFREVGSALERGMADVEHRQRLRTDLPYFAEQALRIRTKSGAIAPLTFNSAQLRIHEALEAQKAKTGKVRALILKARQQGASTYTGARFFWRTLYTVGLRTFILAHDDAASANLFEMVMRFLNNLPEGMRPPVSTANVKELVFSETDSGYKVASARTAGTGRSATVQCLHGSEVGFWLNADTHAAGVLQ